MKRLVLLCVLIFSSACFSQTLFRWVDKDGSVHYTDQPPPPDAKSSQQKKLGTGASVDYDSTPYAVQVAKQKNPVTAYITHCGESCTSARTLLPARGIPSTIRDPENNAKDADALKKLIGGLQVPVLAVGENTLTGFNEPAWNSALDAGGYPRVNPFTKTPEPKKDAPAKAGQ